MKKRLKSFLDRIQIAFQVIVGKDFIFIKLKKQGATVKSYGMTTEAAFFYMYKISQDSHGFKKGHRYTLYDITKVFHDTILQDAGPNSNLKEPVFESKAHLLILPHKMFIVCKARKDKALRLYKAIYK
jgi:hypothetical protein